MLSKTKPSELMQLQTTIQKFTKMLSSVLQLDAEVVDANLLRVAGTGPYSRCLGEPQNSGARIFNHILSTHKEQVVVTSLIDPLCDGCNNKSNCKETAFLGVPIMLDQRCIGVLSVVAFNEESRIRIKDNVNLFSDYIRHISQIFVSKIMESQISETENELDKVFISLIEHMDQGVLVLDKNDSVQFGNKTALRSLNIANDKLTRCKVKIIPLVNNSNKNKGHQQHIISYGDEQELLVGQFHDINGYQLFLMAYHQPHTSLAINNSNPALNTNIIGESKRIKQLKTLIGRISKSPSSVLISGESGTGKDVFAHAIHDLSERANNPFIAINCAAIPEQLLESELFGYEKGAFTGANTKGSIGLIQAANKGTLFLDEIGDMSMKLQAKLLRVLEDRKVMPIGSNKAMPVDIRVISATNKNFSEMIATNEFREDLYYRLNVIPIHLPSLKDRDGDIELFIRHFLDIHTQRVGVTYPGITEEVMAKLNAYPWPGNIRELSNLVEYLVNIVPDGDVIDLDLLPPYFEKIDLKTMPQQTLVEGTSMSLEEMEKIRIEESINRLQNRNLVAKELGIGIATLYRKIKKYNL